LRSSRSPPTRSIHIPLTRCRAWISCRADDARDGLRSGRNANSTSRIDGAGGKDAGAGDLAFFYFTRLYDRRVFVLINACTVAPRARSIICTARDTLSLFRNFLSASVSVESSRFQCQGGFIYLDSNIERAALRLASDEINRARLMQMSVPSSDAGIVRVSNGCCRREFPIATRNGEGERERERERTVRRARLRSAACSRRQRGVFLTGRTLHNVSHASRRRLSRYAAEERRRAYLGNSARFSIAVFSR